MRDSSDMPAKGGSAFGGKTAVIYTTPTCQYCKAAKELMTKKGVKYEEYNVAANREKLNEMIDKSGGMAVPVIDVEGQVMIGFHPEKLAEILEL